MFNSIKMLRIQIPICSLQLKVQDPHSLQQVLLLDLGFSTMLTVINAQDPRLPFKPTALPFKVQH